MRRSVRRLTCVLLVGLAAAALVATGCFENVATVEATEDEDTPVYPVCSHPDSVMVKFRLAYAGMDLGAYMDCLAETFAFHLSPDDLVEPGSDVPSWWSKGCEDSIHRRMFGSGDTVGVDCIRLTMYDETAEFDLGEPDNPYDNRWTYTQGVDLRVTIGEWTFLADKDQRFVFAIEPARADTLWQIVDWWELSDWTRVEDSSWGKVKSMYRCWSDQERCEESGWGPIKMLYR